MKCASNLKRLLSFIMVFAMVLTMLPAAAFAADTTMLYLKPNGNWTQAGARFAAYFFGNGEKWVSMTDSNGDGVYEVEAPAGYPNVIFCRMNPATTDNNWNNKWNQTSDLTIPTDGKNLYTVKDGTWDQGGGTWSTYTYVAPTYTIAGTISPAGWSPENGEKLTDEDGDGIYHYTYTDVAAGSYEFKVTNGTWDAAWPSDNYKLTVEDEGSKVTVIFNAVTKTVSAEVVKEYTVTFIGANVTSDGAGVAVKGGEYTATLTAAEDYDLPETVTVTMGGEAADHTWDATTGVLTIAAVTGNVVITAEGVEQAKYLYLKPNSNWTQANARFAAYFFGNGEKWVSMTDMNLDGIYEVEIPEGYPTVIFCRMNPGTTDNNWNNKWNQTGDLTIPTDGKNLFTLPNGNWDGATSTWSTYVYVEPAYTVAGSAGLCGTDWDITNAANDMTKKADGTYEKVYANVAAGTYEFKVVLNHSWDRAWPASNYSLTVDEDGKTVTVTFDPASQTVAAAVTTAQTPDPGPGEDPAPETVTIYFRNDWMWTDISVHYWGSATAADTSWPGAAMTFVETLNGLDIYKAEIPADVEGFLFNGLKDDGSGNRDQSPNLTAPADGDAYYMHWDNENKCSKFEYSPSGEGGDEPEGDVAYEAIFHFANTVGWGTVNLYTWIGTGTTLTGGWPGTAVSQGEDGFYTATVTYSAPAGQGLNFIFNNGSAQTVDLSIPAADFVEGKVEKWVVLTTQTDGKYNADILDEAFRVVVSPVVDGTTVTFNYENANATSVSLRGSMNDWGETAMAKDADGIWTVTLTDVAPGVYEYKFFVNGEEWVMDPLNTWVENENSAFIILDPNAEDTNSLTVNIHYSRADGNYEGWNFHLWNENGDIKDTSALVGNELVATLVFPDARGVLSVNVIPRFSTADNKWAAQEPTYAIDLSNIVSGTVDFYITSGNSNGRRMLNTDVRLGNKLSAVELDYDTGKIHITIAKPIANAAFDLTGGSATITETAGNGASYTLTLSEALDLVTLYQYKVIFEGYEYAIDASPAYASDKFAEEFTYEGNDLGSSYSNAGTSFVLWAPTAEAVSVKLYATGSDAEDGAAELGTYLMEKGVNGTWRVLIQGDLKNVYYTYAVTVDGKTVEAVDPYARTTGVNGERGMIVDLDSTDPEGWENDTNPNPSTSYTDAIIYELHVRDFSIDSSSGIVEDYMGKFLAFTQTGSTVGGEGKYATGIDYLKALGVTHVHLLPVYDYGSVDETKCENFNWGYDPVNYNVPEGSYSTDPYRGEVRVEEMKQMIMALHEAGISVIMDVVYNHVYDAGQFCFNQIVPGYFSRVDSNASGCGNDTASEREMVSKYIVESVAYWCDEYHIDGFRFDLVGLIDVVTIGQIVDTVHNELNRPDVIFYGEGWNMDSTNKEPGTEMAKQGNADLTPGFAYFSDSIRNQIAGSNGSSLGFVSGGGMGGLMAYYLAQPESWGETWTTNPSQVVQYASCHDNYTLIDKLIISTGAPGITDDIISMNNLSAAIYMTSAGIPFIHAGEEMLREKLEEDGGRCENSYNATDFVNSIKWDNLLKEEYTDTLAYYQGLIAFRKAHAALRMDNAADVAANIQGVKLGNNLVAFLFDGHETADDDILVIFNADPAATVVGLPEGIWNVCVDGEDAGTDTLYTAQTAVQVDGISAMILTREDEGVNEDQTGSGSGSAGDITLYFSNNKYWTAVYAHYWGGTTGTEWPGAAMTYVETNDYGEKIYSVTIPANTTGIVFHNNAGAQTADIIPSADGTGYYCTDQNAEGKFEVGTYTYGSSGGAVGGFTNDGIYEGESQYFLFGYINGQDYACEGWSEAMGKYQFVDGLLTVKFETDSYVGVKTTGNEAWYMTDGWLGNVTSATLYNTNELGADANKLMVPGGVEVTFALVENADGTLTLHYRNANNGPMDGTGIQDGATLHCWNWSFAQIEANMALIAEMGFTAIQTSPIQPLKEATTDATDTVSGCWWLYYQPTGFTITDGEGNALGTKAELESMIATAHEYGIRVIVDVVANHLANGTGNDLSDAISPELLASEYWHNIKVNTTDYSNRFDVTQHCMGGLPDLNTGNADIQQFVLNFLKQCIDLGVDGFRFDGAKHIETPDDELYFESDFWSFVIGGAESYAAEFHEKDIYVYGEVLDGTDGYAISDYTEFMAVTDNSWGNTLRDNVASGNAALVPGYDKATYASNLVIWAESHDTYANGSSSGVSTENINKVWALIAARAEAMGLYFARPASNDQLLGVGSVTGWYSEEVKAVNRFHTMFVGQTEALGNENGISYVVRGESGIVLVNVKGNEAQVELTVPMADGSYVDQLSGNVFTVADGVISGTIGQSGIAVVHDVAYGVSTENNHGGSVDVDIWEPIAGTQVTVTVTPDIGFAIAGVKVLDLAGEEIALNDLGNGIYAFIQPVGDVVVVVEFAAIHYNITWIEEQLGEVTVSNLYPVYGEVVSISIDTLTGWAVGSVSAVDAEGNALEVTNNQNGTFSFVQPACDVTLKVSFVHLTYSITVGDITGGEVKVSAQKAHFFETITITVLCAPGNEVDTITVSTGMRQINVTDNGDGTYTFIQPAADVTVTVTFRPVSAPVDPVEPTEPTDPTDPPEPTDPVEPTDPTEPTDPVEPTDPADPTEPADPTQPTNPGQTTEEPESGNGVLLVVILVLALAATAVLVFVVIKRKKR